MNNGETWFAANIILESSHPEERQYRKLYEQRIILVRATTIEEAWQKATVYGEAAREEYRNPNDKTVIWAMREILDVKELFEDSIGDGSEVYYSFLVGDDELDYLRRISRPAPD